VVFSPCHELRSIAFAVKENSILLFSGSIDAVDPIGRIAGWASRGNAIERLHVGIFHEGRLIAQAVTHHYREDLLKSGIGFGHCAFYARPMVALEPGSYKVELGLIGTTAERRSFRLEVPVFGASERRAAAPATWTDEQIIKNVTAFALWAFLQSAGPARFTDGIYRFIHDRWPEDRIIRDVKMACERETFDPDTFFIEAMRSPERIQKRKTPLPSPFSPRFWLSPV
jgi:hypothetical protein